MRKKHVTVTPQMRNKMRKLRSQGLTFKQISQQIKPEVSISTIQYHTYDIQAGRKTNSEVKKEILKLRKKGMKVAEIVSITGLSRDTIYRVCKEIEIKCDDNQETSETTKKPGRTGIRITPVETAAMKSLYRKGKSIEQIAETLEVSITTVKRHLNKKENENIQDVRVSRKKYLEI